MLSFLNRDQLQKQLQQMSTAHFSSRSPSHASASFYSSSSGARQEPQRRMVAMSPAANSVRSSMTPRRHREFRDESGAATSIAATTAPTKSRPGSAESMRRKIPTVSFKLDHEDAKLDQSQKGMLDRFNKCFPVACLLEYPGVRNCCCGCNCSEFTGRIGGARANAV